MRKLALIFIGLAILLYGGQAMLAAFGPPKGGAFEEKIRPLRRAMEAPETRLLIATGGETTLSNWRGNVAVVTLWATWCPVCMEEMPQLQSLAARYEGRGLSVLTVSIDQAPSEELVLTHLRTRGYDLLPPLLDPDQELAAVIGLRGTPTTLIVDKFGQVVAALEGIGPWEDEATFAFFDALIAAGSTEAGKALLPAS